MMMGYIMMGWIMFFALAFIFGFVRAGGLRDSKKAFQDEMQRIQERKAAKAAKEADDTRNTEH